MSTATKKCLFCKARKRNEEMKQTPNRQWFCDSECIAQYASKKWQATKKKKHTKEKRAFKLSDLKTRKSAAIKACHAYIKRRDLGCNCITCNRPLTGKYDSGHFIKAGNHPYTRFMEKNIHSQCINCNQYNGGREKEYKEVLIKKYGHLTVKALEKLRNKKIVRTAEDYLKIERHYKQKLKELV